MFRVRGPSQQGRGRAEPDHPNNLNNPQFPFGRAPMGKRTPASGAAALVGPRRVADEARAKTQRECEMIRRAIGALCGAMLVCFVLTATDVQAQQPRAFGRVWGGDLTVRDWERFYHYPYVYYPQNFWGNEYYRSDESL